MTPYTTHPLPSFQGRRSKRVCLLSSSVKTSAHPSVSLASMYMYTGIRTWLALDQRNAQTPMGGLKALFQGTRKLHYFFVVSALTTENAVSMPKLQALSQNSSTNLIFWAAPTKAQPWNKASSSKPYTCTTISKFLDKCTSLLTLCSVL